jgi:hypothetical protein
MSSLEFQGGLKRRSRGYIQVGKSELHLLLLLVDSASIDGSNPHHKVEGDVSNAKGT